MLLVLYYWVGVSLMLDIRFNVNECIPKHYAKLLQCNFSLKINRINMNEVFCGAKTNKNVYFRYLNESIKIHFFSCKNWCFGNNLGVVI